MKTAITHWLIGKGMPENFAAYVLNAVYISIIILLSYLANVIAKRIILAGLTILIRKSNSSWGNVFLEKKVFIRLAHLAPALIIFTLSPVAFPETPFLVALFKNSALVYMIVVTLLAADSLLSALYDIYQTFEIAKQIPLKGFVQAVKIVIIFIGIILILSVVTTKTPLFFLSGLGALTAVLMLIFKDAILGFVAGIQLSANDMVREGDWIEMPQFGADGNVIDVSLTTVKVRNWDKTIITVPAYALISQSFKNWRGMEESGGRRIKRSLYIDMSGIKFCDEEMFERLLKIQLVGGYLESKKNEIAEYNREKNIDYSSIINGRRLTNIGTFRAYVEAYLKNHPRINQNMTLMVRYLPPTDRGLPLEIYAFCNDLVWTNYESIQADIFDHLLAALPEFDIRVFQSPSGADFGKL